MPKGKNLDKFDFEVKKDETDISDYYRGLFLKESGTKVLNDILIICHFGDELNPEDKVEIAEYNVGLRILKKCCKGEGNLFRVLSILARGN